MYEKLKIKRKIVNLITLLIFTLLVACSPKNIKPVTQAEVIVFPPPPDTARIQYLTHFSEAKDITGNRKGFEKYILGEDKSKNIIIKPYGIAVHNGKIYTCDTILAGIEIIDLEQRTFEYFQPRGRGKLRKPINCFVDNDTLYVADTERKQIVIFNEERRFIAQIGLPQSSKVTDVSIYRGIIWACDLQNHQIHAFSKKTHKLLLSFPESKVGKPDYLYSPVNICVAGDKVYVSDFGANQIKTFNLRGEFLKSVGSSGRGLGQLNRPKGIAVDVESNLYEVDASFENVQIFDKDGNLLMFFGGHYQGPGGMRLPAQVIIDYDHFNYFQKYVDPSFKLKHLIFVTNQYGEEKISVYGFVESKQN